MNYICVNAGLEYDTAPRSAGDWYKTIKSKNHLTFNQVIPLFKELVKKGDFKAVAARELKKLSKSIETVSGDATVCTTVNADVKAPKACFKPVKYQVSDPNDDHKYKFVKEFLDSEKARDRRIMEIKADKKCTYITAGYNYHKYEVMYWLQID